MRADTNFFDTKPAICVIPLHHIGEALVSALTRQGRLPTFLPFPHPPPLVPSLHLSLALRALMAAYTLAFPRHEKKSEPSLVNPRATGTRQDGQWWRGRPRQGRGGPGCTRTDRPFIWGRGVLPCTLSGSPVGCATMSTLVVNLRSAVWCSCGGGAGCRQLGGSPVRERIFCWAARSGAEILCFHYEATPGPLPSATT